MKKEWDADNSNNNDDDGNGNDNDNNNNNNNILVKRSSLSSKNQKPLTLAQSGWLTMKNIT